jgi:hypothetical protein
VNNLKSVHVHDVVIRAPLQVLGELEEALKGLKVLHPQVEVTATCEDALENLMVRGIADLFRILRQASWHFKVETKKIPYMNDLVTGGVLNCC